MDVYNAFLHEDLADEVYIRVPPGFDAPDTNLVCHLQKSLYGLHQAPRCWSDKLTTTLLEFRFTWSYANYNLFIYFQDGVRLHIIIYVDDLLVGYNDVSFLATFKAYLSRHFFMKDLGPLKWFEVPHEIFSHRKYALDIILECGLLEVKPTHVLIAPNHSLYKST